MDQNTVADQQQATPMYSHRNITMSIVRGLQTKNTALADNIRALLEKLPSSIQGLCTGFNIANKKLVYKASRPMFRFQEREGKIIAQTLQAWAEEYMAQATLADATAGTIDVLFFELTEDGKQIVDAWLCNNMYFDEFDGTISSFDPARVVTSDDDIVVNEPVFYDIAFNCDTVRGPEAMNKVLELSKLAAATTDNPQ